MLKKLIDKVKLNTTEVIDRLQSETPIHFKRTRTLGLFMVCGGLLLKGIGILFPPLLPVTAISWATELIGYGSTIAVISQTAKK